MLRAVGITLASALLFLALPARAQETQPFTSTSDDGFRVVPADGETGAGMPVAVRADGDFASGNVPMVGNILKPTTLLRGRLAASWSPMEGLTAFGSLFSSYTQITRPGDVSGASPFTRVNPYHNWGDFVGGVRWTTRPNDTVAVGLEGGAMFFGAARNLFGGAPDFGATSPFARGLLTVGKDRFRVHANAGVSLDNSWHVWQQAWTDGGANLQNGRTDPSQIQPEERLMLGIYGKSGSELRGIGGLLATAELGPVHPFLETSVEVGDGRPGFRVGPGLTIAPRSNAPHVVLGVELSPGSNTAPSSAPPEPAWRAHLALVYAFGHGAAHAGVGGSTFGGRTARPSKPMADVEVVTEDGQRVPGVRVMFVDAQNSSPARSVMTDRDGHIRVPEDEANGMTVRVDPSSSYFSFPARVTAGQPTKVLAIPKSSLVPVSIEVYDAAGNDLPGVSFQLVFPTGNRAVTLKARTPHGLAEQLPLHWQLVVTNTAVPGSEALRLTLEAPPGQQVGGRFMWDASKNAFVPLVAKSERDVVTVTNLFDPDLADVKPVPALAQIVNALKLDGNAKLQITIHQKPSSDQSFAETLAHARADAIVTWLKTARVNEKQILPSTIDIRATDDSVKLEILR